MDNQGFIKVVSNSFKAFLEVGIFLSVQSASIVMLLYKKEAI